MTTPTDQSNELPIIINESFKSELKEKKHRKKKSIKYNIELLKIIIERDNCKINLDLYRKISLNHNIKISFVCNCQEKVIKTFKNLYKNGGAFCNKCIKNNTIKKENKVNYNIELLCDIIERDNCGIDIFFYDNSSLNRNTIISFVCNCREEGKKKFGALYTKGGAFCNKCIKNNTAEKYKQTCLKNLGVEYPMQSKIIKEKTKKTCLDVYGVEHPMQSELVIENYKQTCFENLGVEYPMESELVIKNYKKTCLDIYGVEHPMKSKIVKDNHKRTCLKNLGVEHPMQNSEVAEKCLKKTFETKKYILPSGKLIQIQGYEHYALNELLFKENIKEDDIITSRLEVPEIWYTDIYNNKHRYYIDIYIKSQNKCIEVKSKYTSEYNKHIIKLKEDATIGLGYKYEMRIYDNKGNRI